MIKQVVLFLLTFTSLFVNAGRENFSELRQLYRKQLVRYDYACDNIRSVGYSKDQSEAWNLAVYGEALWKVNAKAPTKRINWLNAAMVYRVFCTYEKSPLRQRMGFSYHAVKMREQNLGPVDFKTLFQMNISPKYQELYLLYGQHCSLVLRLIEKELFSRLVEPMSLDELVYQLEKKELVEILQKNIPTENIQNWYENGTYKYSSGIYSIMPDEYISTRFKEILTIEIVSEFDGKKEDTINDIRTAAVFGMDHKTATNVGTVYFVMAQRLWFDAPPMLRPAIFKAMEAFTELGHGKLNSFSSSLTKSIKQFSRDIKRSRQLKEWLDITETAVTNEKTRLHPYRQILKEKKTTNISNFLDDIEEQLENAKE